MRCFDSTFVVDYLAGEQRTVDYLEAHADEAFSLPAVVLYEALEGGVKSAGPPEFRATRAHLSWADVAPFGETTAIEAGRLQADLAERGRELNSADAMIGGTARELGATLVTADGDLTNDDVRAILDVDEY